MKQCIRFMLILLIVSCDHSAENSQGENFTQHIDKVAKNRIDDRDKLRFFDQARQPLTPKFEAFPTGSVKPKGWILEMMHHDLSEGMVGALKELYPGIQSDDLYHTARRGGLEDVPEMGDLELTGAAWEKSIMWWNAETIGNWWDGFIRHAFLTENKEAIEQSHQIVQKLLASQDSDGYIGIYKPNLRYQHKESNGELWAQTTAFRALLAYYEFTNNPKVLTAVEKGMNVTMNRYGKNAKNPFELKNAFGGVTHGLMMTDVCETLHRITGKQRYQDYATYLYRAFSSFSINRSFNDLRYPYLMEKDSLFEGHAVHTYEHIRSLVNAYYHTGYSELQEAYQHMLAKLDHCILPSGAGHGNEWIAKLKAHPTHTSSEYCTLVELRNSFGSLMQKTGKVSFADAAERLTYNALLGFRNPTGTALTYGKADNCYVLDGHHHEHGTTRKDPRYKYSPTHSEPAVCCVPNYGRNLSYFMDQMWMKAKDGIAVLLYGPSQLTFEMNGTQMSIEQITNYPLDDQVTFRVNTSQPQHVTLYLRKPTWAKQVDIDLPIKADTAAYLLITKKWHDGDEFTLNFKHDIEYKKALNGETYLQRGPLVYAYEIPHKEAVIKTYSLDEFHDYYCYPKNQDFNHFKLLHHYHFVPNSKQTAKSFYDFEPYLEGNVFDQQTNQERKIRFIPMGKTVLRKVTFNQHNNNSHEK